MKASCSGFALIRASASLRGAFQGHKDLQQLIAADTNAKRAWKTYLHAQYEVHKCLLKWAEKQSPQVQQRVGSVATIQFMLLDRERALGDRIKARRQVFENILSKERICDTFRRDRQRLNRQLASLQREQQRKSGRRGGTAASLATKIQQMNERIQVTVSQLSQLEDELQALIDHKTQEVFVRYMEAENELLRLRASVNECVKAFVLGGDPALMDTAQQLVQQAGTEQQEPVTIEAARRRLSMVSLRSASISEDPPPYSPT
ncbi:hypothetical protein PTSG_07872 [Salpingoeca rosetta]|uniref:Uncharacterized protein n=1 Tax=Salpingoeca rosetta (strain ATCC 50818 / BSB-021) TaxID=946362 RepID=F2UGK5_SALR5|nr:uncharacterized protein PTSG_07872 [Salpingoeca rosetta]EGD75755.1 hypothetical protein PTSG_07872 [Salpingoeca rosetta]|eukprot:XP_004991676.1 hypothetical protein PTSG_07872 [Salpingoeca rosetta]